MTAPRMSPDAAPDTNLLTNSLGMQLTKIPAGRFQMGNHETDDVLRRDFAQYHPERISDLSDERPIHEVEITRAFLLGAHAVTRGQFRAFVEASGYRVEPERDGTGAWGYNPDITYFEGRDPKYSWKEPGFEQADDHPVVNVTWGDAVAFCQWLGAREGRTYRLPTEAQWEYACRAGTTTRFHSGDDVESLVTVANLYDRVTVEVFPEWKKYSISGSDGYAFTAPVGSFQPNGFGLYDMHGNVWEWCADWYDEFFYAKSPPADPVCDDPDSETKVRRGGSWHSWPFYMRSSYRNFNTPETRYVLVGFRVACDLA